MKQILVNQILPQQFKFNIIVILYGWGLFRLLLVTHIQYLFFGGLYFHMLNRRLLLELPSENHSVEVLHSNPLENGWIFWAGQALGRTKLRSIIWAVKSHY